MSTEERMKKAKRTIHLISQNGHLTFYVSAAVLFVVIIAVLAITFGVMKGNSSPVNSLSTKKIEELSQTNSPSNFSPVKVSADQIQTISEKKSSTEVIKLTPEEILKLANTKKN